MAEIKNASCEEINVSQTIFNSPKQKSITKLTLKIKIKNQK